MEGGAAVDARTFQTEALKIEKLLYHISYAMLRNESDCEDAVQEAFLRLITKKPNFRDEGHEKAWLIVCAQNRCRDVMRSARWGG